MGARWRAEERIDRLAADPHLEMQVGELGQSRSADAAEQLASLHLACRLDGNAALLHMAVLGLDVVAVGNDDAISAFAAGNLVTVCRRSDAVVRDAVADRADDTVGGGDDVDPSRRRGIRQHPEIGAGVPVIGGTATGVVPGVRPRIAIDIVLDEAA